MKFVTVDVDDAGTVSRSLTEPAKKRLTNALPVLNAIVAATAGDEDAVDIRARFSQLAREWGCDVPAASDETNATSDQATPAKKSA